LEHSSKNCGRDNGSACANSVWNTAMTQATGARSNAKFSNRHETRKPFALGRPNLDDWLKFFEYAAVDAGRIPDHILEDEKLAAHLPVFFRTLSGQKPSREDMEKLLGIIKGAYHRK
jgi:hypothetical protein